MLDITQSIQTVNNLFVVSVTEIGQT